MANAQQSADPAIIERRLRPVFESLEAGNHKKALSETEKVLKKNPTLQCARALKALSLLRLAREEESQMIIDQLFNERPYVEATLQVMTFWYKEKEQFDQICTIYANAVKQLPGNEELLSHLFMAYVRVNDFQLQQTVALQLYKLTTNHRYYLWAIFSIILKVKCGPERNAKDKTTVLLALAQKMMEKLLADKRLTDTKEYEMYITVLEMQSKYKEIMEFLDTEIGQLLYPTPPIALKLTCLRKMEKWDELNILLKQLIYDNRDRWDYYVEYIKTVYNLQKRAGGGAGNLTTYASGVDYTFAMCHTFLYELISDGVNSVRGPYLARLELHRVMTDNGFESDAIQLHGQIYDLIIQYYRLYGHKPFCTKDLSVFIKCISKNCRSFLSSHFDGICSVRNTTVPKNIDDLQRHICAEQILRMTDETGYKLIEKVGYKHVDDLITMYKYGVKEFTESTVQDFGPADPYAILAAHIIYNLSVKSTESSTKILTNGLCLLKYLLKNSPSNFHAKLLSIQIQQILGYGLAANKTYLSLDIKHVQLDSLGYVHAEQLPSFGIPSKAKPLYDYTLKFFAHSQRETMDFLLLGYKFGSFAKLYEFMDFRDRLSNSLHYVTIATEALLLEMTCFKGTYQQNFMAFKQMTINPAVARPTGDFDSNLSDNRDLDLFQHWNPIESGCTDNGEEDDDDGTTTTTTECLENHKWFKSTNERKVLLIRSTLLRLIAACIELVNPPTSPTTTTTTLPPSPSSSPSPPSNYTTLFNLTNEFSKIFLIIRQHLQRTTNIFDENDEISLSYHYNVHKNVCDLLPTRLFSYTFIDEYEHVFLNVARLLLALFRCTNNTNCTNNNNNNNTSNDTENINTNNNKNNKRNKNKQKSNVTNIINGAAVAADAADVIKENDYCNIMMNNDHDECPETLASMLIENFTIISTLVTHSINKFNKFHYRMWERRHTQECVINCIEALSLITFVVTACNEKYGNNAPAKKGKRKQQQQQHQQTTIVNENTDNNSRNDNDHNNCMDRPPISSKTFTIKQCQNIIELITTELHSHLEICDKALDTWLVHEPEYTDDDVDKLDADVYIELVESVKESHNLMIKELKTIVKDKIRQLS